jgi:hypothetical protein
LAFIIGLSEHLPEIMGIYPKMTLKNGIEMFLAVEAQFI